NWQSRWSHHPGKNQVTLVPSSWQATPGTIERVIYDENDWAPASMRQEFRGHSVILEPSTSSPHTLTVTGKKFGTLVLLVVPPHTDPAVAHTAVTTAADPDDESTPEELLQMAHQPKQRRHRGSSPHLGGGHVREPSRAGGVAAANVR
ncbi:hypothetical protein CQY20_21760, partial [Mycolicibacterium agri]